MNLNNNIQKSGIRMPLPCLKKGGTFVPEISY